MAPGKSISMRFVSVSFGQFHQLVLCKKTFTALFLPDWQLRKKWRYFSKLCNLSASSANSLVFVVTVDISGPCCDYTVDNLMCDELPVVVQYRNGQLIYQSPLSSLYDVNRDSLNYACAAYANECDYISSLFAPSECPAPIGQLFISGDRSSVGKSSVAVALLAALIKHGVSPSALSYIKPVTQCEAQQPVTRYCYRVGIQEESVGPVVFYQGFTRSFLAGETESGDQLLAKAVNAVYSISRGKMLTLVDGVGYPSVGSICSISNADVASALQAPVVLVGKSGVGDAVDSYNLNSSFFEHKNVRVLGGIFNKIATTGYYALDNCKSSVSKYFQQYRKTHYPYGFIPLTDTSSALNTTATDAGALLHTERDEDNVIVDFEKHVDLNRLVHDIWMNQIMRVDNIVVLEESLATHIPSPLHYVPAQQHFGYHTKHHQQSALVSHDAHALAGYNNHHCDFDCPSGRNIDNRARKLASMIQPLGPFNVSRGNVSINAPASSSHFGTGSIFDASGGQGSNPIFHGRKRTREEIEADARSCGAKGG